MKTNKKHFEIFQEECKYWIDFFGLKDWDITFIHDKRDRDSIAHTALDTTGKNATVFLMHDWGDIDITSIKAIKKVAFHEVCEILLATMTNYGYEYYQNISFKASKTAEEVHTIIHRLENSVFEHFYNLRFKK